MTSLGNPKIENMQQKDFQCFGKVCQRRSLPPIGVFTPLAEFTAVLEIKDYSGNISCKGTNHSGNISWERKNYSAWQRLLSEYRFVAKTCDLAQILILIQCRFFCNIRWIVRCLCLYLSFYDIRILPIRIYYERPFKR